MTIEVFNKFIDLFDKISGTKSYEKMDELTDTYRSLTINNEDDIEKYYKDFFKIVYAYFDFAAFYQYKLRKILKKEANSADIPDCTSTSYELSTLFDLYTSINFSRIIILFNIEPNKEFDSTFFYDKLMHILDLIKLNFMTCLALYYTKENIHLHTPVEIPTVSRYLELFIQSHFNALLYIRAVDSTMAKAYITFNKDIKDSFERMCTAADKANLSIKD